MYVLRITCRLPELHIWSLLYYEIMERLTTWQRVPVSRVRLCGCFFFKTGVFVLSYGVLDYLSMFCAAMSANACVVCYVRS
jgi:hypothetical protein